MEMIKEGEPENGSASRVAVLGHVSRIIATGVSEIKRKSAITKLHFEIKGLERNKEKYFSTLGKRAWEAHIEHPDLAGILVNLKEIQIEMNRLETQFGEHDTQVKDIECMKAELTEKFNKSLDEIEAKIVPHRQKIETINAEKENNKKQIEELRSKQDQLSEQVRIHQKNIQELDMVDGAEKAEKIAAEKESISRIFLDKCDIECQTPFHFAQIEKLKIALSNERSMIESLEQEKETSKRDYEHRIKDYNHEIHQLEEKKKLALKQKELHHREMEPYLFDLGKKIEQLRLEERTFQDVYEELDTLKTGIQSRRHQIAEAISLSRAMDRSAWKGFLLVSGSLVLIVLCLVLLLFH
ncbi:MAG: hypothetical protein C5B54_04555 [Acidobacteria bacterium]|nr:MAG: hypothetical protein C5B54_04555 [Acidobacteriota bacterium]